MDDKLMEALLTLEVEREINGILKEESVRKCVSKILSISNLILAESRRGNAQKIFFRGNTAWLLLEEIKRNTKYLQALRSFDMESLRDDKVNYIELVREGDHFYMEESFDTKGERTLTLKTSREKQPDTVKKITIIDKK